MVSKRLIQSRPKLCRPEFHEADEVVLALGTLGVFLPSREDIKWADVAERNDNIRSHPVAWIALVGGPDKGGAELIETRPIRDETHGEERQ